MSEKATLVIEGKNYEFDVTVGTENEKCIDFQQLRDVTGYITMDPGFANTGSCYSSITYVDGAKGILRYRGYPIEEIAAKATFVETAYLVLYGELPKAAQLKAFMARKILSISPGDSPTVAARIMIENDVGHLPVVQEGKMIGIVTRTDILTYYYDLLPD